MTDRQKLTAFMADNGHLDGPGVRVFLRGETVEIWRRSCKCPGWTCTHWEYAGKRPATIEDRTAFLLAQRPWPGREAAPPPDDALARIAERYEGRYPARPTEEMYP